METVLNILVNNSGVSWGAPFETHPDSGPDLYIIYTSYPHIIYTAYSHHSHTSYTSYLHIVSHHIRPSYPIIFISYRSYRSYPHHIYSAGFLSLFCIRSVLVFLMFVVSFTIVCVIICVS